MISITKKTSTTNTTASSGRSIKYIVVHYTAGVSSASGKAANTAAYFAQSSTKASADFIVDDANIVQYNPDIKNRYCWAVGGSKLSTKGGSLYGTAKNANCISVEICSTNSTGSVKDPNDSTWSFKDAALSNASDLVKYLMETYNIDADHVIRHYDVTGKLCVPTYSEVLTHEGWKRIDEVEIGEEIACADLDNLNVSFEEVYDKVPVKYQGTYTNCGLTATIDHRMVYSTYRHKDVYRIDKYGNQLTTPTQVYITLSGHGDFDVLPLTDDMLKFYIAVQADGHYMYDNRNLAGEKRYYGLEFHFSKQRKIDRIKEILESINLDYNEKPQSNGTTHIRIYNADGCNIVNDICEKYLKNKEFTWEWINLSKEQAELFLSEIQLWDGCVAGNLYTSKSKQNLDIVSAIAVMNGIGSKISGSNVMFTDQPYMVLGQSENSTKRNKNHDRQTEVTCVSVKTGIFLMRQNGKTFVVGNCPGVPGWNADSGSEAKWKSFKAGLTSSSSSSSSSSSTTTTSSSTTSQVVKVTSVPLNIRKGAGTNYDVVGQITSTGSFTIVEVASGTGSTAGWGLLKSYQTNRNGWISLDYTNYDGSATTSTSSVPYVGKVTTVPLNIRKGAGTNYSVVGQITSTGSYTIVEEASGTGSTAGWGLLKSYQTNRNGWISLDYVTKT